MRQGFHVAGIERQSGDVLPVGVADVPGVEVALRQVQSRRRVVGMIADPLLEEIDGSPSLDGSRRRCVGALL